jgi:hypothetical protein
MNKRTSAIKNQRRRDLHRQSFQRTLLSFRHIPFFQKYLRMHPIIWQDWLVFQ